MKETSQKTTSTAQVTSYHMALRFLWSSTVILIAILGGIALMEFHPQQSHFITTAAAQHACENLVGIWGMFGSFWGLRILGLAWPLAIIIGIWYGLRPFLTGGQSWGWMRLLATGFALSCTSILGTLYERTHSFPSTSWTNTHLSAGLGGIWGHFLGSYSFRAIGSIGTWVFLLCLGIISSVIIFSCESSTGRIFHKRGLQTSRLCGYLWHSFRRCIGFIIRKIS
jgi:hypothetical protein